MSALVDVMELNEDNVTKCNAGPNFTFYLLAEVGEKVDVASGALPMVNGYFRRSKATY